MTSRLLAVCAALIAVLSLFTTTHAQVEKRSPLGIAPPAAERGIAAARPPAAVVADAGIATRAWMFIVEQQRRFSREMSAAVRQMRTEPFGPAFLTLAFLSFAYGILHAAGPGHGKFVISSYALATGETVRRGIMLSFLAAFFQAVSAIALFAVLALLLGATKKQFDVAEAWLESLSWGLVAFTGAWLLYRQVQVLRGSHAHDHAGHGHHHGHDHHVHAGHGGDAHAGPVDAGRRHAHAHEHHAATCNHPDHHHEHQHDASCGHAHMPDPRQLEGNWSWSRAVGLAASVGIRPCSGALIVLAFAMLNGILWAGIFATFAMALGTAITVSALAALAVGSKALATRLAGPESRWASHIATGAGLAAAAVVLVFGTAFFIASLKGGGPL